MLLLSGFSMAATPPNGGYNYKKNSRKIVRVKLMNKLFNVNRCNGYKYK